MTLAMTMLVAFRLLGAVSVNPVRLLGGGLFHKSIMCLGCWLVIGFGDVMVETHFLERILCLSRARELDVIEHRKRKDILSRR